MAPSLTNNAIYDEHDDNKAVDSSDDCAVRVSKNVKGQNKTSRNIRGSMSSLWKQLGNTPIENDGTSTVKVEVEELEHTLQHVKDSDRERGWLRRGIAAETVVFVVTLICVGVMVALISKQVLLANRVLDSEGGKLVDAKTGEELETETPSTHVPMEYLPCFNVKSLSDLKLHHLYFKTSDGKAHSKTVMTIDSGNSTDIFIGFLNSHLILSYPSASGTIARYIQGDEEDQFTLPGADCKDLRANARSESRRLGISLSSTGIFSLSDKDGSGNVAPDQPTATFSSRMVTQTLSSTASIFEETRAPEPTLEVTPHCGLFWKSDESNGDGIFGIKLYDTKKNDYFTKYRARSNTGHLFAQHGHCYKIYRDGYKRTHSNHYGDYTDYMFVKCCAKDYKGDGVAPYPFVTGVEEPLLRYRMDEDEDRTDYYTNIRLFEEANDGFTSNCGPCETV